MSAPGLRNRCWSAVLLLLAAILAVQARGQITAYPTCYITDTAWLSGVHHIANPQAIVAGDTVKVYQSANVEFVSARSVRLTEVFSAIELVGNGSFRAYIDPNLGDPDDVIVTAPDPPLLIDDVLQVPKWEKLEVAYRLPASYQSAIDGFFDRYYLHGPAALATPGEVNPVTDLNPYADDSLQLVMTLTSPTGVQHTKWGFYMREAKWASEDDLAILAEDPSDPQAPYHVRFRFAPDEEGLWQFALSVQAPYTSDFSSQALPPVLYTGYSFECIAPKPDNHGFLHVNTSNHRTLRFDDETPFFGLGTNMADTRHGDWGIWPNFHKRDHDIMKETMTQLQSVGGNFLRMFLMRHLFAPEWVNLGVYDHFVTPPVCDQLEYDVGCPDYGGWTTGYQANGQYQCWAFDQILDQARARNIYVQLCMDPNMPTLSYEKYIWGAHPYVIHFLDPNRQGPGLNPYDMKEYFYQDGDPLTVDEPGSVFYYWKRRFKYILSRWGYSVNLAILEPFNEMDQMLSYNLSAKDMSSTPATNCAENDLIPYFDICRENRVNWQYDDTLPGVVNNWFTDIVDHIHGLSETVPPQGATGPSGERGRPILLSYANVAPYTDTDYYEPFSNPKIDIIDIHKGNQNEWDLRAGFDDSENFRDTYPGVEYKKPFHQGEFSSAAHKQILVGTELVDEAIDPYFHNYELSFHNELWASTFYGNFAAGTTWHWDRVFWWKDALKAPPPDDANLGQPNGMFTNVLGQPNNMQFGTTDILVYNRRIHHHFKPLSDFLELNSIFLDGDFSAHKVYGEPNVDRIECYYLMNEPEHDFAIGWVHNVNAHWENSWYLTSAPLENNFFGCSAPNTQSINLPEFAVGEDYTISYFPTRMNTTICPAPGVDEDQNSSVTLDLSSAPLSGTIGTPLDTLHSDYAFVIYTGRGKSLRHTDAPMAADQDFIMYPNPTRDVLNLEFQDSSPKDIVLLDLTGRNIRTWTGCTGIRHQISVDRLAMGAYYVRVSGMETKIKKLIVH